MPLNQTAPAPAIMDFQYQTAKVRVHVDDQGSPWFVAKDVCNVLELSNPTEALRGLDDDERSTLRISEGTSPQGGNPNVNIISESGLYTLIMRSNKPEAKKFRRWVTGEVLPTIRRTGGYGQAATASLPMSRYIELLEAENALLKQMATPGGYQPARRYVARKNREKYALLIRLYQEGELNGLQLAEALGLHPATVYRWLKRMERPC